MSLMNDFHNIPNEFSAWLLLFMAITLGFVIRNTIQDVFLTKDTYRNGQIDAIRGIIKYKLTWNEKGEEVWTKIDNIKDKEIKNIYKPNPHNVKIWNKIERDH
jgi:hypothetical protein